MPDFFIGDALTRLNREATAEAQPRNDGWPPIDGPPPTLTTEHAKMVFMKLYMAGQSGLADFELERQLTDISGSSVRSRRAELEYDGFVESTGEFRNTPRGRQAMVYRISRRMMDWYRGFSEERPRWTRGVGTRRSRLW